MKVLLRRLISCLLIVALPAEAGLVATDAAVAGAPRERVGALLERADVRERLEAMGVGAAAVEARVAALSDEEAAALAERIDSLPAGGDGIIGAIVFVFLVLLVTDILGLTKVFPFTKPIR